VSAAIRNSYPEERAVSDAARRFCETELNDTVSDRELWDRLRRQGWVEMLLASDTPAPVRTLCTLSVELGRMGRATPLAETVGPILELRRLADKVELASLEQVVEAGSALAAAVLGEGSEARRETFEENDNRAEGSLLNIEHWDAAGALCIIDVNSHRLLWCLLPQPGISSTRAAGFAPWHDVRLNAVPVRALVTEHGCYWLHDLLRLAAVGRAWGAAQRSLEELAAYVAVREQFGQVVARFQAMQHRLANLRIVVDAVRGLLERAAKSLDERSPVAGLHVEALCCYAGEALPQLALDCQHGFGAIGYMEEHAMPGRFRRIHADMARYAKPARAARKLGAHLLESEDGAAYLVQRIQLPTTAEDFRLRLAGWLAGYANSPEGWRNPATTHFDRGFLEAIGRAGFIGVTIGEEYGGLGFGALEQFAFDEEIQFSDAPYYGFAADQVLAPSLARFGTPEQRAQYLPLMLGGKAVFCLGYSEPNAGSDLASMRTRAERRGDGWVVNGQKIWTSLGTHGDYLWLAARTGEPMSRHGGISVFIVPMNNPGLTIRPLRAMNGEVPCALFIDDLELPAEALIGNVNDGWSVITHALAQERMMMGGFGAKLAMHLHRTIGALRDARAGRSHKSDDDLVADIGRFASQVEVSRELAFAATMAAAKGDATVEAAISKVFSSELHERLGEAAIRWIGPDALLAGTAPGSVLAGTIAHELVMGIMYVVGGGSNDIQRNIIAQRGLRLPR
jgi:3-oxo-4-pregnene-20-carboxyl-CoA dehydrogenase beta subunit